MKIIDQVCTLNQAQELKALGIKQQSFFTWYGGFKGSEIPSNVDLTDQRHYDYSVNGFYGHPDNTFSAFTSSELGVMLPSYSITKFHEKTGMWSVDLICMGIDLYEYGATEAEARAAMLIRLLSNEKYQFTEDDANERLLGAQ